MLKAWAWAEAHWEKLAAGWVTECQSAGIFFFFFSVKIQRDSVGEKGELGDHRRKNSCQHSNICGKKI
jgi:hypothetical protein